MTRTMNVDHSIMKEQVLGAPFGLLQSCAKVGKFSFKDVVSQMWDRRMLKG